VEHRALLNGSQVSRGWPAMSRLAMGPPHNLLLGGRGTQGSEIRAHRGAGVKKGLGPLTETLTLIGVGDYALACQET
jgi:hypothetical protein